MNFHEAEVYFQDVEKRRATGKMSLEEYRAALASLRVTDSSGRTWMMQELTGRWFVYQDGEWIPAGPPQSRPPAAQAPGRPQAGTGRVQAGTARSRPEAAGQPARSRTQVTANNPVVKPRRSAVGLLVVSGLVGVCLLGVVLIAGGLMVYNGLIPLPEALAGWMPSQQPASSLEPADEPASEPVIPKNMVAEVDSVAISPDGQPHADSLGTELIVPAEALEEGGQVTLQASEINADWLEQIKSAVSIDTPFYSLAAEGKNDSTGSLTLSLPAVNPNARVLAVIDHAYLVELAQAPQNGKLVLQTRAGPSDPSDMASPEGYDGTGSIYYAVITPKTGSRLPSGDQLVGYHQQADERNCIPDISIIGGAAINLCRQNTAGTIQVMLPTTQRDLVGQVDLMVDKIEAVMNKYYSLGFTTAQLSHSAPMLVRVSTKITSPSYYPLNGVLYIPVDSVQRIATLSPTDVYHEMAHWIQAVKYSTRLAYYSEERTWWLETSAENMVMLVEPAYVGANLKTYGTITADNNSLALQNSPYQWPGDFYVQAQLVKINLCDSPACPLSPASFAKAISEGSYPFMNGSAKSMVGSNLKDYAFYLLGKMPSAANTAIPLSGPVKTGEGYGEYVRIARTNSVDLKFDYNGADPQMRKETQDGKEVLVIEAPIQRDGVYPLSILGGAGKNAGLPIEVVIQPGASFYYTLDDGELKYSDGSQELIIKPVHGEMGIKKIRLVGLGVNGGEVFRARIQPLSLDGAWVPVVSGSKTGGGMTCSDAEDMEDPDGAAFLMAYMLELMSGTGDMTADPTGRSLDWSQVASRVSAQIQESNATFKATALLAGDGLKYQAFVDIPRADDSSSLPPAFPVSAAAVMLPVLWLGRKKLRIDAARVLVNVLVIAFVVLVSTGCFGMGMYGSTTLDAKITKMEYIGGQDTGVLTVSNELAQPQGQPIWKLTGTGTYDVSFSIETTVTDQDGAETTKVDVCTGQVTYPVTVFIYKDFQVIIPED